MRLAVCTLWIVLTASNSPAAWTDRLPKGWLALAVIDDASRLEADLNTLLPEWGLRVQNLGDRAGALLPASGLGSGPWVVGLAETPTGVDEPFLLAPIDDFDRFCDAIGADRAGSIAIARFAGYELHLEPIEGGARVTLLGSALDFSQASEPTARDLATSEPGIAAAVSRRAVERLHQSLSRQPAESVVPLRIDWPPNASKLLRRLAPAEPLFAELVRLKASGAARLAPIEGSDALRLHATLRLPGAPRDEPPAFELAPNRTPEGAVASFESGPPSETALRLLTAALRCNAHEVEAPSYPEKPFASYARAIVAFLRGVDSAQLVLAHPEPGDPVAANQFWRFTTETSHQRLGEQLMRVQTLWNDLIGASEARSPVTAEVAPLEAGESPTGEQGWRYTIDSVTAIAQGDPDVIRLLAGFYGPEGLCRFVLAPTPSDEDGPGREWIASNLPPDRTKKLLSTPEPTGPLADGRPGYRLRLWVDRLDSWNRTIHQWAYHDVEVIGERERPAVASSPPLVVEARERTADDGSVIVRIEALLPLETHHALARALRGAEPAAP